MTDKGMEIRRTTLSDDQIRDIAERAQGLYILYNEFGRLRVSEEEFMAMYMHGTLGQFIKRELRRMKEDE